MVRPTPSRVRVRSVKEIFRLGQPGYWAHPEWEARFPWLVQGTTGRVGECSSGAGDSRDGVIGEEIAGLLDFGLFMDPPAPNAARAWQDLGRELGFARIAHSRQVHGGEVQVHGGEALMHEGEVLVHGADVPGQRGEDSVAGANPVVLGRGAPKLTIGPDADGHVTREEGLLLGVTIADCVPVFLVAPEEKVVGILHAGWRGTVAGVLEEGVRAMRREYGLRPASLEIHLGPAICGVCYEVGVEVHKALGLQVPGGPQPVDLRAQLAGIALRSGVEAGGITVSAWCTLCGGSPFFSHRGGDRARQVGFLGIRP